MHVRYRRSVCNTWACGLASRLNGQCGQYIMHDGPQRWKPGKYPGLLVDQRLYSGAPQSSTIYLNE